jgi:hypothetical protein
MTWRRETPMLKRSFCSLTACLIIVVSSFSGGLVSYLVLKDTFTSWESLGSPPEKPVKISGGRVEGYPGGMIGFYRGRKTDLYVETVTGQIYCWCQGEGGGWEEVQKSRVEKIVDYGCSPSSISLPNGSIDSAVMAWCGEWDWGQINFALNNDGTVWKRSHFGRFPDWMIDLFCIGPGLGGLAGIVFLKRIQRITGARGFSLVLKK